MDAPDLNLPQPAAAQFIRWLGPLGRYRPGVLRRDLAHGFRNCERFYLPQWARLPHLVSPEERLLLELELTGKVVYDIGAHVGAYTPFFSRRVGATGCVVAFEPQARSFAKLEGNLKLNAIANVRTEQVALGAARKVQTLFMLPGMRTTASLAAEARTPLRMGAGTCLVERLDELVRVLPLRPPDFLKIDVEGMEQDVLAGAAETLRRWHPALLIEVHGVNRGQREQRVRAVAASLEHLGYSIHHAESGRKVNSQAATCAGGHLFAHCAA